MFLISRLLAMAMTPGKKKREEDDDDDDDDDEEEDAEDLFLCFMSYSDDAHVCGADHKCKPSFQRHVKSLIFSQFQVKG
jgi:hypothetical protein